MDFNCVFCDRKLINAKINQTTCGSEYCISELKKVYSGSPQQIEKTRKYQKTDKYHFNVKTHRMAMQILKKKNLKQFKKILEEVRKDE